MCVAGGALMYTANQDTSESRVYGCTVLIGLGVGMWIQASSSVAQAIVDLENVTSVIGFITLDQFLGNTGHERSRGFNSFYLNPPTPNRKSLFYRQFNVIANCGAVASSFRDFHSPHNKAPEPLNRCGADTIHNAAEWTHQRRLFGQALAKAGMR
ncbi:hypothetical protein FQN53_008923 [Emmonsiellopsis sp. PD_33]|nr:hypothetical protein FQN53_008923 [Emmonsiellopsis sp. PD_33]